MAPELREVAYRGSRVTVHSTQPFDSVMAKLYSEIGRPKQASAWAWQKIVKNATDKKSFIKGVKEATGTKAGQDVRDGFMIFQACALPILKIPLTQLGNRPWRLGSPIWHRKGSQVQKNHLWEPPHCHHSFKTRHEDWSRGPR
jgi:hypothetical protein